MITIKEYADIVGLTYSAVLKRIQLKKELPGVLCIKRFAGVYVLEVSKNWRVENIKYKRLTKH